MFENDRKSPLDRLKRVLYSRRQIFAEPVRHDIHGDPEPVPESWQDGRNAATEAFTTVSHKQKKAYKLILIFSALFLFLALAVGTYTLFGGKIFVSVDNIDILIEGPTSMAGGETLNLGVSVLNKNATDIELVDLVAEFPGGAKDPLSPERDLGKTRFSLGNIKSQSVAQKTVSLILFGGEGEEKSVKLTAEYRTADSNAIFFKEKTYRVSISSSPAFVAIGAFDQAFAGQPMDVSISVTSNSKNPLKNLMLSLDYPFGLSVISSVPPAAYGDSIWRLGDLAPGAKKIIRLKTVLQGQDGEEKNLRANVGIQSQNNEREIATTIISRDHTFSIKQPFLGLDLTFDGDRSDLATEAGRVVRAEIIWTNNGASKITDARIEAKLSGTVLDKNSVFVSDGGNYESLTNTVVWEAGRTPGLDNIIPGADGRVGFSFRSVSVSPNQSLPNPLITVAVSAGGSRVDESGAPAEIASGISRSVKLVSNLALSARALYSGGPFQNAGPVPPRAEQATTYTVIWTVTNTSNVVTGARITAILPAYVAWTGKMSPEDAGISYNPTGGTVTWQVGEVPRNADIGSGAKQVAFQVSLLPSANQVGEAPEILSRSSIAGVDSFTGATLQNNAPPLSTRTTADLLWKPGNEIVQP